MLTLVQEPETELAPQLAREASVVAAPAATCDIACVFGTRPEAVKLVSVVEALRAAGASVHVIATGQHTTLLDRALVARLGVAEALGLVPSDNVMEFAERAQRALRARFAALAPRAVLVQGDTTSAYAGGAAAYACGIPFAHVEAGVRSGSLREPWPEEHFRVTLDRLATWRYAPTREASANLTREGFASVVTGNTSMDAVRAARVVPRPPGTPPTLLITLHRRELCTRPDVTTVLQALVNALASAPVDAVWPVHPTLAPFANALAVTMNVTLCDPVPHHTMLATLATAHGVLTDSGGLVEEATMLGVPTAILRGANDRPEAVAAGVARVFAPTPEGAAGAVAWLAQHDHARVPSAVYGDGHAGARIAAHLLTALS